MNTKQKDSRNFSKREENILIIESELRIKRSSVGSGVSIKSPQILENSSSKKIS